MIVLSSFVYAGLDDNKVSVWTWDDDTTDQVGSNNATLTGGARWTNSSCLSGGCLKLFGSGEYASAGTTNIPTGAAPRTMACWVKYEIAIAGGAYTYGYGTGGPNQLYAVLEDAANDIQFQNWGGDYDIGFKGGSNSPWQLITMTYNGTHVIPYVNASQGTINGLTLATGSTAFCFGGRANGCNDGTDSMLIDTCYVWSDTKTSAEISDLYDYQGAYPFNTAPTTPSPSLESVDGTNTTTSDLNCSATISDSDADTMNVTVEWFNNSISMGTYNLNNNYANGTTVSHIFGSGNFSVNNVNDQIICSMQATDGAITSNWGNSTGLTLARNYGLWEWTNISISNAYTPTGAIRGQSFNITVSAKCSSDYNCTVNSGVIHLDPQPIRFSNPIRYGNYWYMELI